MDENQLSPDIFNQIIGNLYTNLYVSNKIIKNLKDTLRQQEEQIKTVTLKYQLQTERLTNVMKQAGLGNKDEIPPEIQSGSETSQ